MPQVGSAQQLADALRSSGRAVVLSGAGISVPSGIPDFRTPETGIWENVNPMEVAHIDVFRHDPERFWSYYAERFATLGEKQPNAAHRAVAELERRGLIEAVITQNIDRLHATGGSEDVIEVHGSIAKSRCPACGASYDLEWVRREAAEHGVPRCESCPAAPPIKPDVVLFGEMLPEAAIARAFELAAGVDLMIAIGSSLVVHPVASLPGQTLASGGKLAIITEGETPYDGEAFVKLEGDVAEELQAVLKALNANP